MAVPQEALDKHVQMTTDLDNYIGQSIDNAQYEQLKNRLKSQLPPRDLVSGSNSIMDILNRLERKGIVKPGKYDVLKKIISDFDVRIVDNVIEPAEKAIKDVISRHERGLVSSSSEVDTEEVTGFTKETGMIVGQSTSTSKLSMQPPEKKRKLIEKASSDMAKHIYEHSKNQTGLMLILNFSKAREGSEGDVEKLKELFENTFKFNVEPQSDLTKDVLLRELKEYRKSYMETSRQSDKYFCFICVIMSHGDQNGIRTDDNKSVTMDEITDIFKNKETPGFVGKPKIFVVQACRGSDVQPVVEPDDTQDIDDFVGKMSVPHDADILVAYATTPGHKAFRTKYSDTGAWFIHVLLEVIKESHNDEHLEEMLITVRHQIALDPEWRRGGYCQMPCCWTTLTKRLYLRTPVN